GLDHGDRELEEHAEHAAARECTETRRTQREPVLCVCSEGVYSPLPYESIGADETRYRATMRPPRPTSSPSPRLPSATNGGSSSATNTPNLHARGRSCSSSRATT